MKTFGCLVVILLVVVGIYLLSQSGDLTDEQAAQWTGEKAHRGWNRLKKLTHSANEGWKSAPRDPEDPGARPGR